MRAGQREDLLGEPRGVARRAHGGKRERHAAAVGAGFDAQLGRDAGEQVARARIARGAVRVSSATSARA